MIDKARQVYDAMTLPDVCVACDVRFDSADRLDGMFLIAGSRVPLCGECFALWLVVHQRDRDLSFSNYAGRWYAWCEERRKAVGLDQ